MCLSLCFFFFFQAEDGIRDVAVTGVQTCALPISSALPLADRWDPRFGEEVGLAAPKRGSQRSASGSAEAVVVIGDQRGASAGDIAQAIFLLRMVVEPGVRAEVAAQIILISCSMPGIAAAASHELHLSSGRAIEVGGLVGDVNLELLDAFHRRGHHSGGSAPSRS